MKKSIYSLALVLLSFSVLCFGQSGNNQNCADPSSSLLWKIDGKQSTVYLFGTLHLGKASFYPLAKEVEQAFRQADHLVFEVDPSAAMNPEILMKMQQQGMLPPDQQLSDHLSPEVVEKLRVTLTAMGLPAATLMRFKPWFLTLMLTSQQMISMGYQPVYGAESYLHGEKAEKTQVLELESIDEQLQFLSSLDGEAYLAFTLNNMEAGKKMMDQMAKAWACAEKTLLTELLVESFDMEGFDQEELDNLKSVFLTDRNRTMADKIENYIQLGKGQYFVAVGSAHYLGEDSVISFLRSRNYDVEAVKIN